MLPKNWLLLRNNSGRPHWALLGLLLCLKAAADENQITPPVGPPPRRPVVSVLQPIPKVEEEPIDAARDNTPPSAAKPTLRNGGESRPPGKTTPWTQEAKPVKEPPKAANDPILSAPTTAEQEFQLEKQRATKESGWRKWVPANKSPADQSAASPNARLYELTYPETQLTTKKLQQGKEPFKTVQPDAKIDSATQAAEGNKTVETPLSLRPVPTDSRSLPAVGNSTTTGRDEKDVAKRPRPLPRMDGSGSARAKEFTSPWASLNPNSVYRPLALIAGDRGGSQLVNAAAETSPELPPRTPIPAPIMTSTLPSGTVDGLSDATEFSAWWGEKMWAIPLPSSLLWLPPLANQREPRMYVKPNNRTRDGSVDTAVGGEYGLVRWQPEGCAGQGLQLDAFAAAFSRFSNRDGLTAVDYRVGLPLTYAKGDWQAKFAFEYTGTHLGDEFLADTGALRTPYERADLVFGAGRTFFDAVRVYGQIGGAFYTSSAIGDKRMRYDVGVEWNDPTPNGFSGRPFAALDLEYRQDQDYTANFTVQAGWQWRVAHTTRTPRIAVEYYTGKSPYGQFFLQSESWVGVSALFDW